MPENRITFPVSLGESDAELAAGIQKATGESRVQVLRWALRFYALNGPWTNSKRERIEQFGQVGDLEVGPKLEGIR